MIARLLARLRAPVPAATIKDRLKVATVERFDACLAFVLAHEGGFVNHPRDPGGATNMGITLATLQHWRGKPTGVEDVRNLERDEAAAIYRKRFWDALRCDDLPAGVDLMVFDFGVNAGPARSVRQLQRALGVTADGVLGPVTLAAARAADAAALIEAMGEARMAYYRGLPHWPVFGTGWARRTEDAVKVARGMAPAGTPLA